MTALFLGCFAFGVILTVASFALGAFGSADVHIPGLDFLGGDHAGGDAHAGVHDASHVSPFNLSTVSAFLAWFGGAGYLLIRFSDLAAALVLLVSAAVGVVGGGIIFLAVTRYVLPRLTEMRQEDYELQGTIGRVSVSIRTGGVGEIVYSMGGTRQVEGARSANGAAIEHGTEVVVLRREKGIAYVERWDGFAARNQLPPGDSDTA